MQIKRNVTVIDVAKKAGVSKSTVSLVLTNSNKVSLKSKLKVQQAIKDTGYTYNREAASLRSRRSNLVAIVINDLANPYSSQLILALEQEIREIGMFAVLVNSGECVNTQTELILKLEEYNVAAYVICPAPGTTPESLNGLMKNERKVVSIMREVEGANVQTVVPDNTQGTLVGTELMLAKGYKNIAFIGGNHSISDYHQRLEGYLQAMSKTERKNGKTQNIQSSTTRNGGREAMKTLLANNPKVEAVMCFNDVVAYGAIEHMNQNKIVPGKQIGIIGFDDLEDSRLMSPALTTIRIDANEIAKSVCRALSNDNVTMQTILVDVELIERDSC